MLGALCARPPKTWILSHQTYSLHLLHSHPPPPPPPPCTPLDAVTASIWRMIIPAAAGGLDWRKDCLPPALHQHKGEGSWNVAWDARPARWLHRLDLTYLLFGVCLVLSPFDVVLNSEALVTSIAGDKTEDKDHCQSSYRVTGVQADGRCLFRAIAHGACLQSGEEAPDETRQRELADELRAQVVDELLKRRKEIEWFIEEDFDGYVKRIQQPYVWGGEPELLMASHVLKNLITVFMKDRKTGELTKVASYGEEYINEDDAPINVLFHGYGHYDILETCFP